MHKIRLGFYYHVPAIAKNDGLYMPGFQGRFVDNLAIHCEQVVCFLHSPLASELASMDYQIVSPKVSLVNIGPHVSVPRRILNSGKLNKLLDLYAKDLDILLLRGPSPLLSAMANASPVSTALLLVGDYTTGINDLPQPIWRKEIIRVWSYWNKWQQNLIAQRSLNFVNSRVLYDELKGKSSNLYETRTTTLTSEDFFIRLDTCQSAQCRLLYVGRMDRAKGLLQIVEAVALLTTLGENVTLDLIGWANPHDPILEEVAALAHVKGISERIKYLGPCSLGPELFEYYIKSDIFVTASLASEGFPRTIWEAMAHSLPVVATRVGSIAAFIEGAAQLVEPGNSGSLADAILGLLNSSNLRQSYIRKGLELARSNTLEVQVGEMVRTMEKWIDKSI